MRFAAVFADHTPDSIGVVVECGGVRMYFSGDSLFNERLFEIKNLSPDIAFVCINGKFGNMNWQQAVELSKKLEVKTAIPDHYDMFPINSEDPEVFVRSFDQTGIKSMSIERGYEYPIDQLL
jgi:L-ascorbate 6-phosphate lactonase